MISTAAIPNLYQPVSFVEMMIRLTLLLGFVSQHRTKSDISDTLDTLDGSVELIVDDNSSSVICLYAELLETKSGSNGSSTDSNKYDVGLELVLSTLNHDDHSMGLTVSSLPPLAASTFNDTVSPFRSALMTLVLSLNLKPCFCKIFWNDLLYHQPCDVGASQEVYLPDLSVHTGTYSSEVLYDSDLCT